MNYLKFLVNSYKMEKEHMSECCSDSRLEYLSRNIFNFTTYDTSIDELFAVKAIEVCCAINARTTFEYIKDAENYKWYLLMCNMPFFANRLEWGTSVRGAWWNDSKFQSYGLWNGLEQMAEPIKFTSDEWKLFINAVIEFARSDET